MGSTNRQINIPDNLRVDVKDLTAISRYAAEGIKRANRLVAEPRTTANDIAQVIGCVLKPVADGIVPDAPDVGDFTIKAGTQFVFASQNYSGSGGDFGPWGDVITLDTDWEAVGGLPESGLYKVVLAVPSGLVQDASTEDTRVKWNATLGGEQVIASGGVGSTRGNHRVADFLVLDSTDTAGIALQEETYGYVRVCKVNDAGGVEWYHVLPYKTGFSQATPPTLLPGGPMTSTVQAIAALASQVAALSGAPWYNTPAASVGGLNVVVTANTEAISGIDDRVTAIEGDPENLVTRVGDLEATVNPALCCIVRRDAATYASFSPETTVGWEVEEYDPSGWHSASEHPINGRITVPSDGIYDIKANLASFNLGAPASGSLLAKIHVNSSVVTGSVRAFDYDHFGTYSNDQIISIAVTQKLSAGDVIEVSILSTMEDAISDPITFKLDGSTFAVTKLR